MSKYNHIFRPMRIGSMTVKNRIQMSPVGPLLGIGGLVTRDVIEWARAIARGGVSIVTLGDSSVAYKPGMELGNAINLGTDMTINPLNKYAEAVQRYGAKASIQLNYHGANTPTAMTREEIRQVTDNFAAAAGRCARAGLDMIMIHGAHGQVISQFVSPRANQRTDEYGGSPANRARLVIEVLEGIRNTVGNRLAIEYRISAEEFVNGGLTIEEQIEFAKLIQDKIDLLHVSAGNLYQDQTLPRMIQPTYIPRGVNVEFAGKFKRELKVPVAAVGSIDLEMAETILAEGKADMIAMARTLLADPDCVNKAEKGREQDIRPCVRCNTCIDRTHSHRLPVRCAVNPRCGREADFTDQLPPSGKKKVVVVGGGPAGMEAARTAASRGHEVILYEKQARLGGMLRVAAAFPFKTDLKAYLDWAERDTLNNPDIVLKLSTEATRENLDKEKPDKTIIAAGSRAITLPIPGCDGKNVVWAGDVITGAVKTGESVAVIGAGLTGSETALLLHHQNKKVLLVDALSLEEIDARSPYISMIALRAMLADAGIETIEKARLEQVSESGITIKDKHGELSNRKCSTVVLALGMEPDVKSIELLKIQSIDCKIIGDCGCAQGNVCRVVREGYFAAIDI